MFPSGLDNAPVPSFVVALNSQSAILMDHSRRTFSGEDREENALIPFQIPTGEDAFESSPAARSLNAPAPSVYAPPAALGGPAPPPNGVRITLDDEMKFPSFQAGLPVAYDADGRSPVYLGSAYIKNGLHPCKLAPALNPPVRVGYDGREIAHRGRYELLPFDPNRMEWVPSSHGRIPYGRRPVEGGYEETGEKLYHAIATVARVRVPGKAGVHLTTGAHVPFDQREHDVAQFEIL
ncbi:hypothetical protein C8Q70DRAFT_675977 [Cubamyces menziesii]|nr:hypothetical protein C8Q70DRAFT_675977 [Cubamyces menziesii]